MGGRFFSRCSTVASLLILACDGGGSGPPAPVRYDVMASGTHLSISPTTPRAVESGATLAFTLTPDADFAIDATAGGTCPVGSFAGDVYTTGPITASCSVSFSASAIPATLSLSASTLVLSVTGGTATGQATGAARLLTLTNTSGATATSLALTFPTFPVGTTAASTCGASLAPAASCTITVTPGAEASSDGANPCTVGTVPVPGTITVGAGNASDVTADVVVLGYGCIHQGGYVFALDDSTPASGSIGGKVATTTDQADPYPNGVIWSVDSTGLPEVRRDETVPCVANADGACNTRIIADYYSQTAAGAPIPLDQYAAGLCMQTIAGYADWYLPAICELGAQAAPCGGGNVPTQDNLQSNLVDRAGSNLLAGYYWSSTLSALTDADAEAHLFAAGGGAFTIVAERTNLLLGVRCARVWTP